jgi:hypothetical protein
MLFRSLIAASIAILATTAGAQDLRSLTGKSEFVSQEIDYLIRNKVVSVFASTKAYCPSLYWWSLRPASSAPAKRAFKNDLGRRMKDSGFTKAEIDHCVENSGFILKNRQLTDHPKNDHYRNYVQPAVLMVQDKTTGDITEEPALVETRSFDDKIWDVYQRDFSKDCTFKTSKPKNVSMNCKRHGKLSGHYIEEGNGRFTLVLESSRFRVAYMTRRTRSYASGQFAKLFR